MKQGTLTFTSSLYTYMKPQSKSVLNQWLSHGKILRKEVLISKYSPELEQVRLTVEHPDFVDDPNMLEYQLQFGTRFDGWNKVPMLSKLCVKNRDTWDTVKVYNICP